MSAVVPEQLPNQARNGDFASPDSGIPSSLHLKSSETVLLFHLKVAQKCAFDRHLRNFAIRGLLYREGDGLFFTMEEKVEAWEKSVLSDKPI